MSTSNFQSTAPATETTHHIAETKTNGFWARLVAGIVLAREAQARREVARYLSQRPDRYLRDIGLSDTEIADLRCQHHN